MLNIIPKAERILRNTGNLKSRIRKKSLKKDTFRKMEGKLFLNDKNYHNKEKIYCMRLMYIKSVAVSENE